MEALLRPLPYLLLLLGACRTVVPAGADDADGDGWRDQDDCADDDASVYPTAQETCNGVDDDCDGVVDDGVQVGSYSDLDGDGYGAGTASMACDVPPGKVSNADDCDDGDALIHPGASEICNGVDDDCDGALEDGYAIWYTDGDEDGWGDPDTGVETCSPTSGSVDQGGDCDDADPSIRPDAEDLCDDGIDSNCDGHDSSCVYTGEYSMASPTAKIYADHANYTAGEYIDVGDVNGDGKDDIAVTTFNADSYAGGGYILPGPLSGTQTMDEAGYRIKSSSATTSVGRSITLGDLDDDGFDDLGIGAPDDTGKMFVFFGPITADRQIANADLVYKGTYDTEVGHGSDIGDINGDGVEDLVIGCYEDNEGGVDAGAVFFEYGPLEPDSVNLNDVYDAKIIGVGNSAFAGRYVRAGADVNGDGMGDVLAAAPYARGGAPSSGVSYLIHGGAMGDSSLDDAPGRYIGQVSEDYAGEGLAMGDVNGDGLADVILGSYGNANGHWAGAAYVVYGPATGTVDLDYADVIISGTKSWMLLGLGLWVTDIDEDGIGELLVGAMGEGSAGNQAGAAYLFSGPVTGGITVDDAVAVFRGEGNQDNMGMAVAAGDLDDDGTPDLIFGAPGDTTGGSAAGAIFVLGSSR